MSFALTYGSFGDLVTTIQFVRRLSQALSDVCGSARHLQELVVDLQQFRDVLEELRISWQQRKQCPELASLARKARVILADCRDDINAFLEKVVTKYGRHLLRRVGSSKSFWDVVKMVQWNLCESERIERFRERLSDREALVQLLQQEALRISIENDAAARRESIMSLIQAEKEAEDRINDRLTQLMGKMEEQAKALSAISTMAEQAVATMTYSNDGIVAIRTKIDNIEHQMDRLPDRIYQLSLSNGNFVFIEDALGWTVPVQLDYCPSWETVHSILQDQFARHKSPGIELLKSKRYILQDDRTKQDAPFHLPFHHVARPGQRYAVAMLVRNSNNIIDKDVGASGISCPRCGTVTHAVDLDLDVTCNNPRCQLIYRPIHDVSDFDEQDLSQRLASICDRSDEKGDDRGDEKGDGSDDEDEPDNNHPRVDDDVSWCTTSAETAARAIEVFKRVRLLTRWEDRLESRAKRCERIGDTIIWSLRDPRQESFAARMALYIRIVAFACAYRPCSAWPTSCFRFGFVGRTRAQSLPVIVIISKNNRFRKRLAEEVRSIDWVKRDSGFAVVSINPSRLYWETLIASRSRRDYSLEGAVRRLYRTNVRQANDRRDRKAS